MTSTFRAEQCGGYEAAEQCGYAEAVSKTAQLVAKYSQRGSPAHNRFATLWLKSEGALWTLIEQDWHPIEERDVFVDLASGDSAEPVSASFAAKQLLFVGWQPLYREGVMDTDVYVEEAGLLNQADIDAVIEDLSRRGEDGE